MEKENPEEREAVRVTIIVKMNICNTQETTRCTGDMEAIIDSGSFNTWIPKKRAQAIELRELGFKRFRTISGEIVEQPYGAGVCTVDGATGVSEVVFGETSDATALGALTMEELGIKIDPRNGRITREDVFPRGLAGESNRIFPISVKPTTKDGMISYYLNQTSPAGLLMLRQLL